jgi:CheY-like chemotaxis protein
MNPNPISILLADDDKEDRMLFKHALGEVPIATNLITVNDGEELMKYLTEKTADSIDIIFLDLSMPRKTGFECLAEIKEDDKLKDISIVVFSTSFTKDMYFEQGMINMLTKQGADHFIRKPGDFEQLKTVIYDALKDVIEKKTINQI